MPADITVNLPDGNKAHFPLGTPTESITKALAGYKAKTAGMIDPQTSTLAAPARALTEATVGGVNPPVSAVPMTPFEKGVSKIGLGPLQPGEAMVKSGRAFGRSDIAGGVGAGVSAVMQTLLPVEGARVAKYARNQYMPKDKAIALDRYAIGLQKPEDLMSQRPVNINGTPQNMTALELATHELAPTAKRMGIDFSKSGLEKHPEVIREAFNYAKTVQDSLLQPVLNNPFNIQQAIPTQGGGDPALQSYHRQTGKDVFDNAKKILSKETINLINNAKTVQDARDVESLIDYDLQSFYNSSPGSRSSKNSRMEVRAAREIRKSINSKIDALAPGLDITTNTISSLIEMADTIGQGTGGSGLASQLRMEQASPVLSRVPSYPLAASAMGKSYGLMRVPLDVMRGGTEMRGNRVIKNAWRYLKNEESLLPQVKQQQQAPTQAPPPPPTQPQLPPGNPPGGGGPPPGAPTATPLSQTPVPPAAGLSTTQQQNAIRQGQVQGAAQTISPALPIGGPLPKATTPVAASTPKAVEPLKVTIGSDEVTLLSPEERQAPNAKKIALARFQDHSTGAFSAAREVAKNGEVPDKILNKIIKDHSKAWKEAEAQLSEEVTPVERKAGRPTKEQSEQITPAERAAETRKVEAAKLKEARAKGDVGTIIYGEKAVNAAENLRARIAKSSKKPASSDYEKPVGWRD